MHNYIVSESFGKVEMSDDYSSGMTIRKLYCDQCGAPNLVEGYWFLKNCPNIVFASFECVNCNKTWPDDITEGEIVTEHNMDILSFCC